MSVMIQDLLLFYKYGGKQLYYFNTFDGQGEINVDEGETVDNEVTIEDPASDEECESCVI